MDDYKVLYQKIVWELEDDVRAYLTKGYKTAGGVGQVKTGWFSWEYYQAVVKYED